MPPPKPSIGHCSRRIKPAAKKTAAAKAASSNKTKKATTKEHKDHGKVNTSENDTRHKFVSRAFKAADRVGESMALSMDERIRYRKAAFAAAGKAWDSGNQGSFYIPMYVPSVTEW